MVFYKVRIFSILALVGILVFSGAGLAHEIIPHEHHGSAVWGLVHSVIAGSERGQSAFIPATLLILSVSALCILRSQRTYFAPDFVSKLERLLHTGVLRFRAFG